MPIPYHVAAERAQRALETVYAVVECPICDLPVKCRVDGTDVTVVSACPDHCHTVPAVRSALEDYALTIAASWRESLTTHLRDGGA